MRFRIIRDRLSPDCVNSLAALFEHHSMASIDISAMVAEIESWIQFFKSLQDSISESRTAAETKRRQISNLINSLHELHRDTRAELEDSYTLMFRMPAPHEHVTPDKMGEEVLAKKVLSQSLTTHLIRMDDRGRNGIPVPLVELMGRLALACELSLRAISKRPGPRGNKRRVVVATCLLDIYERFTGAKATTTPSGVFDSFLAIILEEVAGEPDSATNRPLIEAAMAEREQPYPDTSMRELLSTELGNTHSSEDVRRFLGERITPYERMFRERRRKLCS